MHRGHINLNKCLSPLGAPSDFHFLNAMPYFYFIFGLYNIFVITFIETVTNLSFVVSEKNKFTEF